jgi:hypothetical protein
MYGVEIPKDYRDVLRLDKINGDTKWHHCTFLKMGQLTDYRTFEDLGLAAPTLQGYKRIRVHVVYAVKHDGRCKARLVVDGHLTDLPLDSIYSGVVSLKGHLDRAKRIVRYLVRFKHGAIEFRVKIPNYSDLQDHKIGRDTSIYEGASKILLDSQSSLPGMWMPTCSMIG